MKSLKELNNILNEETDVDKSLDIILEEVTNVIRELGILKNALVSKINLKENEKAFRIASEITKLQPFYVSKVVLGVLNSFLKTDHKALYALLHNRVPASPELMGHPTLMVQCESDACKYPEIGLLGVLNGIVGGEGKVIRDIYETDDKGNICGFSCFELADL